MSKKKFCFFLSIGIVALGFCFCCASAQEAFSPEVLDACREWGASAGHFPKDITSDELIIESFDITGAGQPYTVWIVTTSRQCPGVEFGWVSYLLPSGPVLGGWNTEESYWDEKRYRQLETERGTYWFWPAEERAAYEKEKNGENVRTVSPSLATVSQEDAVAAALDTLRTQADFVRRDLNELAVSSFCWREENQILWVVTLREGTPPFSPVYGVNMDAATGDVVSLYPY